MEKKNEQIWLCILTKENFDVVKKERLYGVPARAQYRIEELSLGDTLVFYVISPKKRIVGISKVASSMFEEKKKAPWKDRLYPYRVRIDEVEEISVPYSRFVGKISGVKKRIPMGSSIIPLNKSDLEKIRSLAIYLKKSTHLQ